MKAVNLLLRGIIVCLVLGTFTLTSEAQLKVDENLPEYKPVTGVTGNIKSVGSDTMNNLMTLWTEGFKKFYPNVQPEIEGKGSSTAPPALISGSANFGPMSRSLKAKEIDSFEEKFGYKPVQLPSAVDVVAVYVNKDNPIEGLTLPEVDAIFSKTRRGGYANNIQTWGQLGLSGEWVNQPISIYGRNAASGTYGFFKSNALFGGDFKDSVKEQPGSSAVVQGVASDKNGIGYSGIGYKTADVRAIAISMDKNSDSYKPNAENAYTGHYPLARFLLIVVNYEPESEIDPLRREFLKYIYSKEGQRAVIKDGYYPISAKVAKQALKSVGIDPVKEAGFKEEK